MNQILVTEKLYVTPQIKRKKKMFKVEFIISTLTLLCLSTYGICSAYDRNKNEAISKEILSKMEIQPETKTVEEQAVVIYLNSSNGTNGEINIDEIRKETVSRKINVPEEQKITAKDGTIYYTIGNINIPKIKCKYPILASDTTNFDTMLKIAPCKFYGANPNDIGNLCVAGHNYRNSQFFSKVPTLEKGDIIEITDSFGETLEYEVYDNFIITKDQTECISQQTNGKREVTLITCTNANDEHRVIVKAREKN